MNLPRGDIEKRLNYYLRKYDRKRKIEYFVQNGKRLRPLLCLLTFRACGGIEKNYINMLDLAVAIELQHSTSLVYDDIMDGDIERRDKLCYYKLFGIEDAFLTGTRALVLGLKKAVGNPRIMKTFWDILEKSLEGEIDDLEYRKNFKSMLRSGEEKYFDIITNKTAALFAGSAKLGSLEAEASENLSNLFWEYGKQIGIGYQLADDSKDCIKGDIVSIPWIIKELDLSTRTSFINGLNEGLSPRKLLSEMNINTQAIFDVEIRKSLKSAENLINSMRLPENKYRSLLMEAPKFLIDNCLKT